MENTKTVVLEVRFRVRDPAALAEYQAAARRTLSSVGAEPILRGAVVHAWWSEEETRPGRLLVRFESRESLETWFESPAYQALSELRERAMDAVFEMIEVAV